MTIATGMSVHVKVMKSERSDCMARPLGELGAPHIGAKHTRSVVWFQPAMQLRFFDLTSGTCYTGIVQGGMAEWTNAAVLKTVMALRVIGGSNPSPSEEFQIVDFRFQIA